MLPGLIIWALVSHWWNNQGTLVFSGFSFTALPKVTLVRAVNKYIQALKKKKRGLRKQFLPILCCRFHCPPIVSLGSHLCISPPSAQPGAVNHAQPVRTPGADVSLAHVVVLKAWATGPQTPPPARHPYSYTGIPLAGLASSPAYGGAPSPRDQASSTMHGVVLICSMYILNHAHYSWTGVLACT